MCGAGMEIRKQRHGDERKLMLHCSAHKRKGSAICQNKHMVVMADAEAAVLKAVKAVVLNPQVIEEAISRSYDHVSQRLKGASNRDVVVVELGELELELERLTEAVATGGNVTVLVKANQNREQRKQELQLELRKASPAKIALDRKTLMADVKSSWRPGKDS